MKAKPAEVLTVDALFEFVTRRYQKRIGNRSIDGDTTIKYRAKVRAIQELETTIKKAVYSTPV